MEVEVTNSCKEATFSFITVNSNAVVTTAKITLKNYIKNDVIIPEARYPKDDINNFLAKITTLDANYELNLKYGYSNDSYYYKVDGKKIFIQSFYRDTLTNEQYFEFIDDELYMYTFYEDIWTKEKADNSSIPVLFYDLKYKYWDHTLSYYYYIFDVEMYTGKLEQLVFKIYTHIQDVGINFELEDEDYDGIFSNFGNVTVTLPTIS